MSTVPRQAITDVLEELDRTKLLMKNVQFSAAMGASGKKLYPMLTELRASVVAAHTQVMGIDLRMRRAGR